MPDDNLEQNSEEQEQKINDTTPESVDGAKSQTESVDSTETDKESKEGFFKSTVNYIRKALKSEDSGPESESEDSSSETDIPDDFSNAAESLGWTGDDIIEFASKGNNGKPYTNQELNDMVPELLAELESDSEKEIDKKSGEKTVDLKTGTESESPDKDKELREQIKKEIMEELGIDSLKEEIGKVKEDRELQDQTNLIARANELFDKASETFKVFGLSKDLPKYPSGTNKGKYILSSPAFQVRAEVYGDAEAFMKHQGLDVNEAMEKALNVYKGKHLEVDVKRKVVKDLKKHEKHLSGSRTGKEVKKVHGSERDEDIDYIRGLQRAAGQDVD